MTGIRIEQKLFEDVFRATLPKLAAHLDSCGLPLSIVTTNWFMCLYTNTLPAETLLRVWDLLIFEDPSVLVRVGVALLKLAEPELLAINDFIELSNKLQQLGRGMWSADKLLTVAYKQLGHTPGSRRALNALQQMQQTAYEVSLSLIDAVREVRMREGLLSADGMSGRTVDNAMAAANAAPTPRWGNLDELLASAENGNSAAAAEEEAVEEQAPSPEQAAEEEVEAEEAGPAEEKAVVQIGLPRKWQTSAAQPQALGYACTTRPRASSAGSSSSQSPSLPKSTAGSPSGAGATLLRRPSGTVRLSIAGRRISRGDNTFSPKLQRSSSNHERGGGGGGSKGPIARRSLNQYGAGPQGSLAKQASQKEERRDRWTGGLSRSWSAASSCRASGRFSDASVRSEIEEDEEEEGVSRATSKEEEDEEEEGRPSPRGASSEEEAIEEGGDGEEQEEEFHSAAEEEGNDDEPATSKEDDDDEEEATVDSPVTTRRATDPHELPPDTPPTPTLNDDQMGLGRLQKRGSHPLSPSSRRSRSDSESSVSSLSEAGSPTSRR